MAINGVLSNAALNKSIREHRAHLHISKSLALAPTFLDAAPTLVKEIGVGLDWQASILWLVNPEQTHLECVGFWEVACDPSPKSQSHDVEVPELSKNLTVSSLRIMSPLASVVELAVMIVDSPLRKLLPERAMLVLTYLRYTSSCGRTSNSSTSGPAQP